MSIANELSSDVAAALLCRQEEERGLDSSRLVNVIVEVHSTLRHLTIEARRNARRAQEAQANLPPGSSGSVASASSGHR
jgi:non-ribosomal peptide synthetase component E (peptide arylation enzyme)